MNNVGPVGQVTRKLGLNVNPIRVDLDDARTVLRTAWKVLRFLEEKDHNQCAVSHLPIQYKGEIYQMGDLMEKLEKIT